MNAHITKFAFLLTTLLALLLAACQPVATPTPQPDVAPPQETEDGTTTVKTIYIGPQRVACEGVAPQTCYQYKEAADSDWLLFYDEIAGFEWQPGFTYELRVAVQTLENPPADASALRYELVEVVSQSQVEGVFPQYVQIDSPRSGVVLADGSPIVISGMGGALFEGTVAVELLDEDGNQLLIQPTIIDSPEAGTGGEGPWQVELNYEVSTRTPVTIHAFATSPRDGSIVAEDQVEVVLVPSLEVNVTLENTPWRLVKTSDAAISALLDNVTATLTFDSELGRAFGSGGCNNFFAPYTVAGGQLSFGPAGSTMMACQEPQMQVEQAYLRTLEEVTRYSLEGELLVLLDDAGTRLLEFELERE